MCNKMDSTQKGSLELISENYRFNETIKLFDRTNDLIKEFITNKCDISKEVEKIASHVLVLDSKLHAQYEDHISFSSQLKLIENRLKLIDEQSDMIIRKLDRNHYTMNRHIMNDWASSYYWFFVVIIGICSFNLYLHYRVSF